MPYIHSRMNSRVQMRGGRVNDRPVKSKKQRPRMEVDREAVAALAEQFEAERMAAEEERARKIAGQSSPGTALSPTGRCHDCGKAVTGERRFCGLCLASH